MVNITKSIQTIFCIRSDLYAKYYITPVTTRRLVLAACWLLVAFWRFDASFCLLNGIFAMFGIYDCSGMVGKRFLRRSSFRWELLAELILLPEEERCTLLNRLRQAQVVVPDLWSLLLQSSVASKQNEQFCVFL